ncbi:MAG: hypothetical protein KF795_00820 [Labilithrix sp.]|nr:hypothetical protein [Labilithrix sp.]
MVDPRLRNLERLDSRAVPLPHGTEVVTRIDRVVGERRVPQGTVGRVTKVSGDAVDVTVVGVGVLRYARGELTPRRLGQALFAHRRAEAVRLIATATRWLRGGTPTFEVEEPLRSRLFAIKRGEVALSEVLAEADAMALGLEAARDVSTLPKRPDVARIDAVLRRIGEELARRWVTRVEGPFGKDAPPAPEIVWNE